VSELRFVIDYSRCIGCQACVQACEECDTHRGRSMIHLETIRRAESVQTAPQVCMHCDDPICAQVCPADAIKQTLAADNEGAGPLFKMKRDPRITRVGGFLRRYSLDEVPQLFNVVSGKMSLVGPRPPLPEETEQYAPDARRRLLVKPGLTGLWQVSGRSDLTWAESIRLDLRYVEDWSLALDLMILWKTFRAVMGGQGAY